MTIYEQIAARRITPDTTVQSHDFLYLWGENPCFARGELVALTGKAKSGKTYICSLLMALAQKKQIMGLRRKQDEPYTVLWIDTEQSEDSTHEILSQRIATLIERPICNEQFFVYNFRQNNWQERLNLVLSCIALHKPDLVIFDGIRDVVGDINNYQEAQTVLGKLLSIASWSNACIVCVLHQNKALEDKTLRGALGTELQNKSFETYECQKDPDTRIFTLRQTATRKYDITHKLEFTVNNNGLPIAEMPSLAHSLKREEVNEGYKLYANQINTPEIVSSVFGELTTMRACDFKQKVMHSFQEVNCDSAYRTLLSQAYQKGLISKRKINENETYYDLCSPKKQDEPELLIPSLF